jgi:putative spermidine/putrescine transport system permease protein
MGPGADEAMNKNPLKTNMTYLLLPAVFFTSFVFLFPLIAFLRFSFNHHVPGKFMEAAFTLENYRRFFTEDYYLGILRYTVTSAAAGTVLTFILAFPIACVMSRSGVKVKSLLVILLVFPMMVGGVIRSMGWIGVLTENGLINRVLLHIKIIKEPLKLLYTKGAVVFIMATIEIPMMTLILEAAFEGIHPDIAAAAKNLGAGAFNAFIRVTLPLVIPGILAGTLLVFVQCMNTYTTSLMIGGPKLPMMAPALYGELTENLNWPFSAAMSAVLLVLTLGITYAYSHALETRYIKTVSL